MQSQINPPDLTPSRRGAPAWTWLACAGLLALAVLLACSTAVLGVVLVRRPAILVPPVSPSATGVPVQVLFRDDFSSSSSGWEEYDTPEGSAQYKDGSLELTVKEPDLSIWSNLGRVFEDFTLEVSGHVMEGPADSGYGVLFRYKDENNFYEFDVSGDGYYILSKMVDGNFVPIVDWTQSAVIQQGQATNRLRITAIGTSLTCTVNGQLLVSVTDSDFARGTLGLAAGPNSEAGGRAAFDNLEVSKPQD